MTQAPPNPASVQLKLDRRLASIADLAHNLGPECADVFSVLAKAERALKALARRMEALPGEWESVELVQARGPVVTFTGKMLRHQEFDTARGKVRLEIWQTDGGNLVAVDSLDDGENGENIRSCTPIGGIEDQHMAIMDFFGWSSRARSMARKLGWSMRRDVD